MIAWLNTYIRYIEWGVFVLSIIITAWATHRIDSLLQTEKTVTVIQKEIQVVHDIKTIRERVSALPSTDVDKQLQPWLRKP